MKEKEGKEKIDFLTQFIHLDKLLKISNLLFEFIKFFILCSFMRLFRSNSYGEIVRERESNVQDFRTLFSQKTGARVRNEINPEQRKCPKHHRRLYNSAFTIKFL